MKHKQNQNTNNNKKQSIQYRDVRWRLALYSNIGMQRHVVPDTMTKIEHNLL